MNLSEEMHGVPQSHRWREEKDGHEYPGRRSDGKVGDEEEVGLHSQEALLDRRDEVDGASEQGEEREASRDVDDVGVIVEKYFVEPFSQFTPGV